MGTVLKVVRWLSIAVLGISGLALMVAPALAQRELYAARSVDHSDSVGLPDAQTVTAASAKSPTRLNPTGAESLVSHADASRVGTPAQSGRGGAAQSRPSTPGVGSVGDLLGLALLILGLAVALYSRPRPRIEYTPPQ